MREFLDHVCIFCRNEQAAEVTELAIVLGLIVAGAVASLAVIGPLVKKMYDDTYSQFPN